MIRRVEKWLNRQNSKEIPLAVVVRQHRTEVGYNQETEELYADIVGYNKKFVISKGIDAIYEIYDVFDDVVHNNLHLSNPPKLLWFNEGLVAEMKKQVTLEITVNKVVHTVPNHQNRIFELFKKYDMKSYYYNNQSYEQPDEVKNIQDEYYNTPLHDEYYHGLTNQNENFDGEYEDYIWAGKSIKEIETNPERYNGRWSQDIWRKSTVWRIL